ncbi:MAG: hypothetical protein EAZ57_03070 [Cytophagales bacterium]|nr:MAG: hypothetical protein EAZ67_03535 [Cytophagales bacterium]TAF61739.1 MAG: hypothetical protein EAZ57_03070 [Cytophagales bacterium]
MKRMFFLIVLFCCTTLLFAQSSDSIKVKKNNIQQTQDANSAPQFSQHVTGVMGHDNLTRLSTVANAGVTTFDNRYQGVRGTPFMSDMWSTASIMLAGNSRPDTALTKFLIYQKQEIRVQTPKGDSIILANNKIDEIVFLGTQRTFRRFVYEGVPDGEFFEVLCDGLQYKLLAKRGKKLVKADMSGGTYVTGNPYDELVPRDEYYVFSTKDSKMSAVKQSKTSTMKVLTGQEDKMNAFYKSNKLDLDKDKDFAKFVAYYDSLIKP